MTNIEIKSYVTDKGGVVVLNGPFPIEKAKRVAALCDAAPSLLDACNTLAQDCRMALSGEWDKGDEGFQASLELLESVIAEATGGAMVNSNCLEGIRCPSCGNEAAFYIEASTVMYVTDDGAESRGDTSWNDDSHAECTECERSGKLADFKTTPLAERKAGTV